MVLITLLLHSFPIAFSVAESVPRFYVFANTDCPICVEELQPLRDLGVSNITIYNVKENDTSERYSKIINLVSETPMLPLVGVFENDKLFAVVLGFHSGREWQRLLNTTQQGVPVYSNLYKSGVLIPDKTLNDQKVVDSVTRLFLNISDNTPVSHQDIYTLLPLIVTAAAVDAINPCELYVLTVFLSLVYFRSGRKALLKAGIAFSIAIFVVYYLMGLGLIRLITYFQEVRILIVVLGLFIGLRETIGVLLDKEIKRVPDFFSSKLSSYLKRVSENPATAFLIGAVTGIFLLPCTSGPYFVATSLLAELGTLLEGLFLLAVYNSVIVAPFLVITLGIYTLHLKTGELKRWSAQRQKWLNLTAGLLMIFLSIYLLTTIL